MITHLKLPFDASYGVCFYGFMVQQCVFATLPGIGVHGNQAISALIAISMATLSWYFIEKPSIAFGAKHTRSEFLKKFGFHSQDEALRLKKMTEQSPV